jgi:hypothetical protein
MSAQSSYVYSSLRRRGKTGLGFMPSFELPSFDDIKDSARRGEVLEFDAPTVSMPAPEPEPEPTSFLDKFLPQPISTAEPKKHEEIISEPIAVPNNYHPISYASDPEEGGNGGNDDTPATSTSSGGFFQVDGDDLVVGGQRISKKQAMVAGGATAGGLLLLKLLL